MNRLVVWFASHGLRPSTSDAKTKESSSSTAPWAAARAEQDLRCSAIAAAVCSSSSTL
jgi:hypothetical protein